MGIFDKSNYIINTGLRYHGRHSVVSTGPPAGSHECSGSTCLENKSLWSYHSATLPPALASCAAAHIFQACCHGIPVRPWTWTGIPGRRPSASRPDFRSTMPAVIKYIGIGCPDYVTFHGRRPSVFHRRGTNMEQFASWSDVIKFRANLQTKIKSHLFSALFPYFLNCYSVCKVSEVLQHFSL